jgi:hypothetical protein
VIVEKKPVTVFFSDQNFCAMLPGVNNDCLAIVRMEDASLSELLKLSIELFGDVRFPEGSVFLYGTASYLSRVGTGIFAREWLSVISNADRVWPGVRICPLIPLILSECPGTLSRELSEIAAWFAIVYENNPLGMQLPWSAVVSATENLSVGATTVPHMDSYKIPLPKNLSDTTQLNSMTFCSVSSRPATLSGLSKDTLSELVRTLISTVNRDFQTCFDSEILLPRVTNTVETNNVSQRVILVGGSNLGCCADRLRRLGKCVVDLTVPGWVASSENVCQLTNKLGEMACGKDDTVVADLYGNLAYRFEQFDGSLSLPYKASGKYHMAGNIVICPTPIFKRMMESTSSIFNIARSSKIVVVPPLPRYLFSGCCKQAGHSANVNMDGHSKRLLMDTISLRNNLKKFVSNLGLSVCRVIDTCCVTDCNTTADIESRIEAVKKVSAQDGVHFTSAGYDHLVNCIVNTPAGVAKNEANATKSVRSHFWRGFRSTVGSSAGAPNHRTPARGRGHMGRGRNFGGRLRHHPYKRN